MKQIFTPNDLLRYIYKEMGPAEQKILEQQLNSNEILAKEYDQLLEGISVIENAAMSPSNELIRDLQKKLRLESTEQHPA